MSPLENVRVFASQRLNAALEEILSVFESTVLKYEREAAQCREVISRQHALLSKLHQPFMEWDAPLTDCLTKQLLLSEKEAAPSQPNDQIPNQGAVLSCSREEQQKVQQQELHQLEIIGSTHHSKQEALQPSAQPQTLNSDRDVQTVLSSETEDSDDYNKESAEADAASNTKQQKFFTPSETFRCRLCNSSFRSRRVLFQHVKGHQQEAQQVCGLCGEQCRSGDDLTRHLQAHFQKKRLQIQIRSHSQEKRIQELSELNDRGVTGNQRPGKCEQTDRSPDQKTPTKRQRMV